MNKADIPFLSATELGELIYKREVSPVEATEAYLERVDRLDSKLNAFLTVCGDEALKAAREAELEIAQGRYRGPMHGIPVAVKDQLYTNGIRTTFGSRIFDQFIPDHDATVIVKLKAAGAILLGKLNMSELGLTGFHHCYRTPRNPWDLERYTGGSSSGSAAATAGFLCATSLGEDTGSSIRWPATWCGLVGLRPSWGRVSRYGLKPGTWSMDTVGPISRTVEDCAITLRAIAGYDPNDPYTWQTPVPDYKQALDGNIKGVRVGVVKELLYAEGVEPEIREIVSRAIEVLGELGALVEEVSIPLAMDFLAISGALKIEAFMNYRDLLRNRFDEIGHANQLDYLTGSLIPAYLYYKAQKLRSMLRHQVLDVLERTDALVMPTAGRAAERIEPDAIVESGARPFDWHLTPAFSWASTPALSICCGFTAQNLPVGLQVGGRPFEEQTVLKVAHAYQQNTPWHTHRPPTWEGVET